MGPTSSRPVERRDEVAPTQHHYPASPSFDVMKQCAVLTGLAVGDALGMPFETEPPTSQRLLEWDGVSYLGSDYHLLSPGQWTDDTMMACLIAQVLIENGGYVAEKVSARYAGWLASGDLRGMGKTTRAALQRLQAGVLWTDSGVLGSLGNGSAMRAAPIGVWYRDDLPTVDRVARLDAAVTHRSPEASDASAAVALAAALLALGVPRFHILRLVLERLPPLGAIAEGLSRLSLDAGDPRTEKTMAAEMAAMGTRAVATQTVPAAFYAFLHGKDYLSTVSAAVQAGGDTDTTAAIAGALAGIFYGRAGIPAHLLAGLEAAEALASYDAALMTRCVQTDDA